MDSIAEGLTIDETRVNISPLVPCIILDYYHMRDWKKEVDEGKSDITSTQYIRKHNEHTLGVLLGRQIGHNIIISNAFGTKLSSTDKYIDEDYVDFMKKYLTKGTKETIVGMFYVSNEGQGFHNVEFMKAYNFFNLKVSDKNRTIILTIDGSLNKSSLNIRTFSQLSYSLGSIDQGLAVFNQVPHQIMTEHMSDIGLDTVLYGQENYDTLSVYWRKATESEPLTLEKIDVLKETQKIFDTTEKLKINISNISDMLESANTYVDDVIEGKIEGDPEIGRALSNCLSKISHITSDSIEKLLKDHYQDLLTLSKLTNQIKTQISTSFPRSSEIK